MPRVNTGLPWEQAYRLEARQIIKGLSISANGKRSIKSTQIFWRRSDTSGIRTEYASSIKLPWKEEAVEKNLDFIKETVERSLDAPEITFKQHLEDTLRGYARYSTSKDDPVLLELRLIRNYLEKLTLLQEVKND